MEGKTRKLKDLRKGQRMWYWYFTDTTPILIESAKREGDVMRVVVRWGESLYECIGPALGFTCLCYSKFWKRDIMFTCSYDLSRENEKRRERIKNLVPSLKELIEKIEEL